MKSFAPIVLIPLSVALSSGICAAEQKDLTWKKSNMRSANKTTVMVGDREFAQEVLLSRLNFSDPSFSADEWVHIQSDYNAGNGPHQGYYIDTHQNGDQAFGMFKGTQTLTTKADGSWEATWSGTYEYLGGTGKYKNIKGKGTYKGRATSTEPPAEEGRESVEY